MATVQVEHDAIAAEFKRDLEAWKDYHKRDPTNEELVEAHWAANEMAEAEKYWEEYDQACQDYLEDAASNGKEDPRSTASEDDGNDTDHHDHAEELPFFPSYNDPQSSSDANASQGWVGGLSNFHDDDNPPTSQPEAFGGAIAPLSPQEEPVGEHQEDELEHESDNNPDANLG